MTRPAPWPFQRRAIDAAVEKLEESGRTLIIMPTGTGKSLVSANVCARWRERTAGRIMAMAHLDALIGQNAGAIFRATGLECDIEKADAHADRSQWFGKMPCIVTSVQTQISGRNGTRRMHKFDPGEFSILWCDEAHRAAARSYRAVFDHYRSNPRLRLLGCTATPDRHDEKAIGHIFGEPAFEYYIRDAVNDGWLVPVVRTPYFLKDLDFSGIDAKRGDLTEAELEQAMPLEEVVGPMAHQTFETARDRQTVIFAASIKHAEKFVEVLNRDCCRPGSAQIITGKTPHEVRPIMFKEFDEGKFQFLVNVGVLVEGWNSPKVQVISMCRPTKSRPLYEQMLGRGTRVWPGLFDDLDHDAAQLHLGIEGEKEIAAIRRKRIAESRKPNLEVIDFVGNSGKHDFITAFDVFAGEYPDDVIDLAERKQQYGKPRDVMEGLSHSDLEIARREEAEKRRRIGVVKGVWEVGTVLDTFGLHRTRVRGWESGRELTDKMRSLLTKAKVPLEGLSYSDAGRLCGEIIGRWKNKQVSSYKMINVLKRAGLNTKMSQGDANEAIVVLRANGWKLPQEFRIPISWLPENGRVAQ